MEKINILIADLDIHYTSNLERFLRKNYADKFNICVKNSIDEILKFVNTSPLKLDILLASPELLTEVTLKFAELTLVLSAGLIPIQLEKYHTVKKLQDGDSIVKTVLQEYNEVIKNRSVFSNPHMPAKEKNIPKTVSKREIINSSYVQKIQEIANSEPTGEPSKTVNILGVFSPVGGSGKTTIAALLSRFFAANKPTLFFSLEQLQFSEQIFSGVSKYNLSDFLQVIHKPDKEVIAYLDKILIHDARLDVDFINSPLSFADLNVIKPEMWEKLFRALRSSKQFEYIVVDMGGHISDKNLRVMELCDKIIVPVVDDRSSLIKVNRLIHDLAQLNNKSLLNRFLYIQNKYRGYQPHQEIEIFRKLSFEETNAIMDIGGEEILQRPIWQDISKLGDMLLRN
ncbi:MAG: hypothetical protein LBQ68_04450 [Clostridiales bacterium]|jgi:cellulose biosynthesis protein BcsQ|nr:hypothetical protein [Clostridiales bacterium]